MGEPAPLIGSPSLPVPARGAAEWVDGFGGVRLRAALFRAPTPRGSVVLSPGRTEPIEKYFEVVTELQARGLCVLVHDWRGHGLSGRLHRDPLRGHADGCRAFLGDYGGMLAAFEARLPRPWFGLGHSMGGGLTLLAILEGVASFSGVVLSAPMLGLQLGRAPPALARSLAFSLGRLGWAGAYAVGRGDALGGRFEDNVLTHDRRRWERTRALLESHPELQLAGVTWGWLDFAFELSARLARASVERLEAPLAIVAAGDERLVDNALARTLAAKVPGASYVEIEGAFHELLMETDAVRARFWSEFDALVERASPR